MALIKCPECGRDNISSYASACPNCGYPIAQMKYSVEGFTGSFYKAQFDNGLAEGTSGLYIVDYTWASGPSRVEDDYFVQDGVVHINSRRGLYNSVYKSEGDYLFKQREDWIGNVPDSNTFNTILKCQFEDNTEPLTITFSEDGTYNECVQYAIGGREYCPGVYRRNADIIVRQATGLGLPHIMIVCDNVVHDVSFVSGEKAVIAKRLLNEIHEQEAKRLSQYAREHTPSLMSTDKNAEKDNNCSVIRCPYCNSTNIKKISAINRIASIGFFGFASSKVGKQWKCLSCTTNF